jgi:hypothetical protein
MRMHGSTASPRSTITLKADLEAEQQPSAFATGRAPAVNMRSSNRSEGDTEVTQQQQQKQQHVDAGLVAHVLLLLPG